MKKTTSPVRRLFLTKNFIMMLVLLVVIVMSVSAWFTFNKTVKANNMTVKAVSTEIDIAKCLKQYDVNGEVTQDGPDEFTDTISFDDFTLTKDCTGDGMSLIVPEFNISNDFETLRKTTGKEVNTDHIGADAISNIAAEEYVLAHPNNDPPEYQYIQFEFYARSKNPDLMLNADTRLVTKTETMGKSLSDVTFQYNGVDYNKKSAYGNFNVDGLAGAIRVSVLAQPCGSVTQNWVPTSGTAGYLNKSTVDSDARTFALEKQLLWYPRPDVYLKITETTGDISTWELHTGESLTSAESAITHKNSYYRRNGTGVQFVENDTDSKTKLSTGTYQGKVSLGQSVSITSFEDSGSQDREMVSLVTDKSNITAATGYADYYVTKFTVRVWIEGTDTEARRAMDGGAFDLIIELL